MGVRFKSPIVVEPFRLTWFDIELPEPRPHEAIFRIRACLICGSDLHVYKGLHPFAPLPACCGHEVAAEVVEVGKNVASLRIGDRVYVSGAGARPIPCGQCFRCIRGEAAKCPNPTTSSTYEINGRAVARFPSGFGQYTIGHEGQAYRIPDNVTYCEAAVTTDMAYVAGVVKRSGARIGDSAVILGAGPIGLRTLEVAKLVGVSPIIVCEPIEYRLAMAREMGADETVDPQNENVVERILELTDGNGVDLVYDTTGNATATNQGLAMLRTNIGGSGRLIIMGLFENPSLTINVPSLMYRAGRIVAEWGVSDGPKGIEDVLAMMSQRRLHISKWITHKFPEERADEAMMMLIQKRDKAIGVEITH